MDDIPNFNLFTFPIIKIEEKNTQKMAIASEEGNSDKELAIVCMRLLKIRHQLIFL